MDSSQHDTICKSLAVLLSRLLLTSSLCSPGFLTIQVYLPKASKPFFPIALTGLGSAYTSSLGSSSLV